MRKSVGYMKSCEKHARCVVLHDLLLTKSLQPKAYCGNLRAQALENPVTPRSAPQAYTRSSVADTVSRYPAADEGHRCDLTDWPGGKDKKAVRRTVWEIRPR